jgi:hypothetical protein
MSIRSDRGEGEFVRPVSYPWAGSGLNVVAAGPNKDGWVYAF